MKRAARCHLLLVLILAVCVIPLRATVWLYSVPIGKDPQRRAYLWIPENCQHVRGVIIGVQNMLEQLIFEDPDIRRAAADSGLAIMWITPADDFGDQQTSFLHFKPGNEVVAGVEKVLADLAAESGYSEIADAPLMVTSHSAATPFASRATPKSRMRR